MMQLSSFMKQAKALTGSSNEMPSLQQFILLFRSASLLSDRENDIDRFNPQGTPNAKSDA
jgi:hypothetical protein